MTEANKNTLNKVWDVLQFYILPIFIAGFLVRDAIFNVLIDTQSFLFAIVLFFAGAADAAKDTLDHHFFESVFNKIENKGSKRFFNTSFSWTNKYIDGNEKNGLKPIYKYLPFLIIFSDAWHLFKGLQTALFVVAIFTYHQITTDLWRDILLVYGIYKYGFSMFYNKILLGKW